nr:hypothetical protein [Tanacetum cinerariifolium]
VILNGDSPIPTRVIDGVVQPVASTTAEQRLARKNKLKACDTLLMALPDKHQLKFNIHKDAKTLREAIEKMFGGNKETKKRNKTDLEDQSLDDLFNRLKIYKADVKSSSTTSLTTSPTTQSIAFLSSQNTDSTNESVSVVVSVSTASTKVLVYALSNVDTLNDAVIYSLFASQSNSPQLDNDDLKQIDADYLEEMNLKWQMAMLKCYNCHRRGHFARECRSPKDNRNKETQRRNVPVETSMSNALVLQCDGVGSYDWSFQAEEEPINYALMAFTSSSSSSSDNKNLSQLLASQTNDKTGLGYDDQVFNSFMFDCDEMFNSDSDVSMPASPVYDRYKSGEGYHAGPPPYTGTFMPSKPDLVSDSEDDFKGEPMTTQKAPSFVQTTKHVKTPRPSVKPVEHPIPAANLKTDIPKSRGHRNSRNRKAWNMSYLTEFEEIKGGYVTFGGNPKGGKITGIKREFSVARTPQQNGIAKRKNMTLIEAARTMLADSLLPIPF